MSRLIAASMFVALLSCSLFAQAQEIPKMPEPVKEHAWLKQFVGDWETEAELYFEPGKPPMKSTGTESARMLGGYWVVSEGNAEVQGKKFNSLLTIGYDADKKEYTGTWVDSMSGHLWVYKGKVDEAANSITFDAEGPCPMRPGQILKFKETTVFKSPDHRVFTSLVEVEDGKWEKGIVVNARRKK